MLSNLKALAQICLLFKGRKHIIVGVITVQQNAIQPPHLRRKLLGTFFRHIDSSGEESDIVDKLGGLVERVTAVVDSAALRKDEEMSKEKEKTKKRTSSGGVWAAQRKR